MNNLKAIAFDWGGVVIDEPSHALQEYCAEKLQAKDFELACQVIWGSMTDFQNKTISEWDIWDKVCKKAQGNIESIPPKNESYSLWAEAVRAVFTFKPEIVQHIKDLRQEGYKTAFLSNTEDAAAKYFHELNLDDLFDVAILSCEIGISKPDPKIYQLLIDKLNLKAHEIAFLDDRPENIDGANALGIKGYLFSDSDQYFEWFKENK